MDNFENSSDGDQEFNNRAMEDLNLEELNVNITLQSSLQKNNNNIIVGAQHLNINRINNNGGSPTAAILHNDNTTDPAVDDNQINGNQSYFNDENIEDIHTARRPGNESVAREDYPEHEKIQNDEITNGIQSNVGNQNVSFDNLSPLRNLNQFSLQNFKLKKDNPVT